MVETHAPDRPSIAICVCPHVGYERKLREVQAGMEEEGIPYVLETQGIDDAVSLASQAAGTSQLGVGVGIGSAAISIHYCKLPEQSPLFNLIDTGISAEWRRIGYNAARLVKGIPFKDQPAELPEAEFTGGGDLHRLVRDIVMLVLQETAQDHGEVKVWSKTH